MSNRPPQAVNDWLDRGLGGQEASTVQTCQILAHQHVIPAWDSWKLTELSAEDVDVCLANKDRSLSIHTRAAIKSVLGRAITRAHAPGQGQTQRCPAG